jgi:dTMP kinase
MFVVFEGIDGSGKTTISNRVAIALRARGLAVEHVREGGAFASGVTQRIRDMCRDARNLALTPCAEFMLYVAREAQLREEALAPALGRADVVIADRYLYTAEVLGRAGRDLPEALLRPILDAAAAGLWPDLAVLIDVDPTVARGRRKVSKILTPDPRPASRKGLAGSGLQIRLRQGYRAVAAREPGRWVVIDNSDEDLEAVVARVVALIESARTAGPAPDDVEPSLATARAAVAPLASPAPALIEPKDALAAFLTWVDHRAKREPGLAAYVLAGLEGPGIDERRLELGRSSPRVVARGLRGLQDPVSWQLRRMLGDVAPDEVALSLVDGAATAPEAWRLRELLAAAAPAEVASSLLGLDDDAAWAFRAALYDLAPEAVLASLGQNSSARAWELRERWLAERGGLDAAVARYDDARAAARSVTGLEDDRAWVLRKAARDAAPVPALASLRGATSDRAWQWRAHALERAPKPVLSTIGTSTDPRAWQMRQAAAPRCREVLDSMIGLDDELAWDIREACLDLWPSTVIKSLGPLVSGPRGADLLARALARHADSISLLKYAAAFAASGRLLSSVMAA